MCNSCKRLELHFHLDYSNLRLLDCINSIEESILKANELGLSGIAITDHETVSGHLKAIQTVEKLKKEKKIAEDFKLILGNEIYLVESLEDVRDNYKSGVTKFPHFLLLAKNKEGHEALRKLSSQAWLNSFYTGTMERVPTEMNYLKQIASEYPNTLIASSACLGSATSIYILEMDKALKQNNKEMYDLYENKLHSFINWCIDVFGKEDFYLELQPSGDYEQKTVNLKLLELSEQYGLELIITNDVHYLRPEDREIHSAYLRSKEDERETDSFYSHTYLHNNKEIFDKLNYIPEDIIHRAFQNTIIIGDKCEIYTLEAPTEIPKSKLPEFEVKHLFKKAYDKYQYIEKMANSKNEQDRYLLHLIEKGFMELIYTEDITKEYFHKVLSRIDVELEQLWKISEKMNQAMSSYYVTTTMIVNLIWGDDCGDKSYKEGSLLGSGRGSAVAFLINYLIGITQINPLAYGIEIPYWRHLNHEMGDVSSLDIDLDVTSTKKKYIYERMRNFFGQNNVLQVCTFGKEKPKSAINTACRGLGIDNDTAQFLGSFIPFERGEHWSLSDCIYGNEEEGREPVKEFIKEINKYPKLLETALKIEGLINKRSTHAGGVLVTNDHYVKSNALMRSPNGDLVTQYNLDDSQAMGNIKYDLLTIEANDKIQTAIELLLENGEIEWQGTLRKTFNKYFHPEVINKTDENLFKLVGEDKVPDLFQFSTAISQSVVKKVKPSNLIEITATNSIMRLMSDGKEQPIDTFVKFKNNINLWYDEMKSFGLNEEEIKIFEEHLLKLNGVADTQESVMLMAMDKRIAGFDLFEATKLRKGIAKKKKEASLEIRDLLYKKGKELGNRKEVIDYLWHQIERMLSYAFSLPHTLAYSLIAMEELNIFNYYNPLYWQTGCLTVNSGSQEVDEDDKKKEKKYGKVAEAIGKMKSYGVKVALPDINKAKFSFTPDIENNQIIYSLKGIVGINDDVVRTIIENRPYTSFEDFYNRIYKEKLIQKKHMVTLIKAGAFNSFDSPFNIMRLFVKGEIEVKESLNMQNFKSILRLGLLDTPELKIYKQFYNFKEYISKKVIRTVDKPKDKIFGMDSYAANFYYQHFKGDLIDGSIVGESNGYIEISEKKFKKEFDEIMQPIKELMNTKEFVKKYNEAQFLEQWYLIADGTIPKWEMESVSYYSDKHELDGVNFDYYGISDFFKLDPTPIIIGYNNYNGRETPKYQTFTLVGTVLDRDKNKHTVSLLTPTGVVTCKLYTGSFAHYDKAISRNVNGKKETVEKSWFTRGNLLMVRGFRREDQFVLRTYGQKGMPREHTINLINEVREDGSLVLQSDRIKI